MLSRVQQGRAAERNDRRFLHPRGGLAKQIYLPSLMKRPNLLHRHRPHIFRYHRDYTSKLILRDRVCSLQERVDGLE